MIKAICDKCGKEVTLVYSEYGLENPVGWDIEIQYNALQHSYNYKTFCIDCNPKILRKVVTE